MTLTLDNVVQGDTLPIILSGTFLYQFTIDHAILIIKLLGAGDPTTTFSSAGGKIVVTPSLSAGGQVNATGPGPYQVTFTLTVGQTTLLTNPLYVWEVNVVDSAGDVRHLVVLGQFLTVAPASQASS